MNDLYLQHYGVKGMRWGHRKRQEPTSDIRKRYDSAKSKYKTAKKEYNKSFNKAYSYTSRHPIGQYVIKKQRVESDKRWEDAIDKADKSNKAKTAYKEIKRERKQAIKDTYRSIHKDSSFGEKIMYNDATRKLAAKYVVDNNMSMQDAKKKANEKAIKNTAAILAVYGGVLVGNYVVNR